MFLVDLLVQETSAQGHWHALAVLWTRTRPLGRRSAIRAQVIEWPLLNQMS